MLSTNKFLSVSIDPAQASFKNEIINLGLQLVIYLMVSVLDWPK